MGMSEREKDPAMKEGYLWDGSGEPDPEVQKLESLLRRYRHDQPAPAFDPLAQERPIPRPHSFPTRRSSDLLAAAAAVVLMSITTFLVLRAKQANSRGPAWEIARIAGAPRVGWHVLSANSETAKLKVGQTLVTDNSSRASITLEETGRIEVDPQSRLRVIASRLGHERLSLERGTIHATIWAPPGEFVVDTPSAVAVDLGCVYTLQVDDSGNGTLRTTVGWVGFRLGDRESFVPAGAACHTRKLTGPGTPYFEDASNDFRAALAKVDLANPDADYAASLEAVLTQARKRDALTLWHLLTRVSPTDRGRVFDRLAQFVPAPAGVTREGI